MQAGSSILAHALQTRASQLMVELLIKRGANTERCHAMPGSHMLSCVALGGSIELMDLAMERFPGQFTIRYAQIEHAVLGAGYFGHTQLVHHLLTRYGDEMRAHVLNTPDGMGFTILKFACLPYGATDPACIRAYLEWGEDPNLTGAKPVADLTMRILFGLCRKIFWLRCLPPSKVLEFMALLGPGANATPLHMVAYAGKLSAVELLLQFHADVNSTAGVRRLTPLHCAAMREHETTVATLLSAGADATIRDGYGRRPADWARSRGFAKLAATLKKAEARAMGSAGAPAASTPPAALRVVPPLDSRRLGEAPPLPPPSASGSAASREDDSHLYDA